MEKSNRASGRVPDSPQLGHAQAQDQPTTGAWTIWPSWMIQSKRSASLCSSEAMESASNSSSGTVSSGIGGLLSAGSGPRQRRGIE